MPIRAENRARYPKEWPVISLCQRCHNRHDAPNRRAGIRDRTMNTHDLLEAPTP